MHGKTNRRSPASPAVRPFVAYYGLLYIVAAAGFAMRLTYYVGASLFAGSLGHHATEAILRLENSMTESGQHIGSVYDTMPYARLHGETIPEIGVIQGASTHSGAQC
jgi:hypothetical protein